MTEAEELGLPPHAFDRQDGGDDLSFYAPPRLVTHIDENAVAARGPPRAGTRRIVVVSFSNRCFPSKAVAVWRALDMQGHAALVRLYLEKSGFRNIEVLLLADGHRGDPLVAVTGRA